MEESAFMSKALLAEAIRPVAIGEIRPMRTTGSSAMMGLRKITSSSTMMITMVPTPTRIPARSEASLSSRACAAEPVMPAFRSVPFSSGLRSLRSCSTASCWEVSSGSVTFGMATIAVCTSLFGETSPGSIAWTSLTFFAARSLAIRVTSAESAAVIRAPSERWNTMIAPMFCCRGKSRSCRSEARMDS